MKQPVMYFFVGGPASGKSTIIARDYRKSGIVLVDSDLLLDFMSFELAKETATWLLQHLLGSHVSVVVAATGAHYEECAKWFERASEKGYHTCLVHVVCSREAAWERNCSRVRQMTAPFFNRCWDMCDENIPKLKLLADEVLCVSNN